MHEKFHIPSLDGIRALSILIVFASHVGFGHIIPGGFGVTVFFFLSGYLITMLLTREYDRYGVIAQPAFYLRRVLRLGPPLAATLAVSYALLALGLAQGGFNLDTLLSQIFFYYNYYSLYAAAPQTVDGLGILWSLAVEEHFYLLWPTLFICLSQSPRAIKFLIGLLALALVWRAARWCGFGANEWEIYISTHTRLDSMLFGCLLAFLQWRGAARRLFPEGAPARYAIMALAGAGLLASLLIRDETFRSTLRYTLQGLALAPFFHYAVTRPKDFIFRPLNWTPIRRIGQWSFTIYLIHFVIIKALVFNGVAAPASPLLIVLALTLSIGYAALIYRWVEKPLHPLRRRTTGH